MKKIMRAVSLSIIAIAASAHAAKPVETGHGKKPVVANSLSLAKHTPKKGSGKNVKGTPAKVELAKAAPDPRKNHPAQVSPHCP